MVLPMSAKTWMIYGAYGYTGRLLCAQAVALGMRPLLGGRAAGKLVALAAQYGLEQRAFALDSAAQVGRHIKDCALVLHCAGPFSATAPPMMDACREQGVHYLDITGEIDVFEYAQQHSEAARIAGTVVCPGVGFDVIPTDCVAATLKVALPDASELALGFAMPGGLSPGTAKTSFEGLAKGGRVRRDGQLTQVPLAYRTREIDFGAGVRPAVSIPWGDVSTAYYTTGIGNITAYIGANDVLIRRLRRLNHWRWLLGLNAVQNFAKRRIAKRVSGPDAATRERSVTRVWGEVRNKAGEIRTARMQTANGYDVTVHGALAVVERVLNQSVSPGATTPAQLMGADFASRLPGSTDITVT